VLEQLDGFELPAGAWEGDVLSARCEEYDPALLDTLCLTGRVGWGRLSDGRKPTGGEHGRRAAGPIRSTPVALFLREHAALWLGSRAPVEADGLPEYSGRVLDVLRARGASFFHELVGGSGLLPTQVEQALGELAAAGLVTSDGFAGLRAVITPSSKRKPLAHATRRHRTVPFGIESAGRWALLAGRAGRMEPDEGVRPSGQADSPSGHTPSPGSIAVEHRARALLLRYGVVFRRLLEREANAPLWRDLLLVYRRLEARGELRGGRFVAGMAGEQFALPEAVGQLRAIRREAAAGNLVALSAADPLNLTGIITPGERVPALGPNRVLYEDGVPLMALIGGEPRLLAADAGDRSAALAQALVRKRITPALRVRLAMSGVPASAVPPRSAPSRRRREPIAPA